MPIYVAQCECGHTEDYYQTVEGRDTTPDHCGKLTRRIITAPSMVIGDIQPYQSMCDGTMVMGRMQHRDHLKRHGVVEVGDQHHTLKAYGDYRPKDVKPDLIRAVQQKKDELRRR